MAVKKIDVGNIPQDKLNELKPLMTSISDYVVIGKSVYEIFPTPATKLLSVLTKIITLIKTIQRKKEEELNRLDIKLTNDEKVQYMRITQSDILSDEENIEVLKEILVEILEGVDEEDFNNMTTGQLTVLVNKLIEINVNTLPESAKNKLFNLNSTVNLSNVNKSNIEKN